MPDTARPGGYAATHHHSWYQFWHGIKEFCGDCKLTKACKIRGTEETEDCGYVLRQRADDAVSGKPLLVGPSRRGRRPAGERQ